MEILLLLSVTCLLLFMVLATYDGAYLHLWKYELFNKKESLFEHKVHAIRAVLFPLIVWLLFINTDVLSFNIALILVAIDLIVLGIDAYSEEESRDFMGGLPKWEYIIHLFSNSFHFAAIILLVATRLKITGKELIYANNFAASGSYEIVQLIAVNILPGAIVLAIIHVLLSFNFGRRIWNQNRLRITCC